MDRISRNGALYGGPTARIKVRHMRASLRTQQIPQPHPALQDLKILYCCHEPLIDFAPKALRQQYPVAL